MVQGGWAVAIGDRYQELLSAFSFKFNGVEI